MVSSHLLHWFLRALRADWTSYNFPTVSVDRRASSGDGFSDVWQHLSNLSILGSEVQGPESKNCSTLTWQLNDKVFMSCERDFLGALDDSQL